VYEAPTLEEMARVIDAMREGKETTESPTVKPREPTFLPYRLPNGMDIFHQNEGETKHFYEDIFAHRSYVKHGIRIPANGTVFDVGGNIGLFTLFAANEAPTAQIYTFEPAPPLFAILSKNVQTRGAKAELFNMGLSNREAEAPFTFYPQSSGMSSFYPDKAEERHVLSTIMDNQRKLGMTETDQVLERGDEYFDVRLRAVDFTARLRRVSDIIRERGVERIDLMKVDVQKAELEVLEGIDEADWPKFQQIVLEVHDVDGRANHVASLLRDRGFSVIVEQDTLYVGTNIHNIYAVRESRV
jgi:phthiocerol/phenolphthiocerol synthesis type-I polyketide synthase E